MHGCSPSIQKLAIHLPEKQLITFRDDDNLQQVIDRADSHVTTLVAWFKENADNPAAHNHSFKEAYIRLGLLQDDTEWDVCLREACCMRIGQQLRLLFAIILIFCQPAAPEILWNNHKLALCEDILYQNHDLYSDVNDAVEQEALRQLESYLQLNAKRLNDFPDMPLFWEALDFLMVLMC
ncbi:hypothetical protein RhiirA4_423973 [Rhizophagus irregularis]|uniref:Uncharacterized protein n=1 Tax=Rhizophagus irregularis TaxID=588596 RepID=A0A2I1GVT7_9GLOM|nr:hypothetical protein RhiirA4_423973 [Rhizophagus irregularis]